MRNVNRILINHSNKNKFLNYQNSYSMTYESIPNFIKPQDYHIFIYF